jgi:aminopeptidase N
MSAPGSIKENLTRDEASERVGLIAVDTTRVWLDLTQGDTVFGARSEITFEVLADTAISTFLDATCEQVDDVLIDGVSVRDTATITPTRIMLDGLEPGPHTVTVHATMRYQHEGNGLHYFVDPADQRVYLHSQCEPFDAHLIYPCFDQPDLKTVFALEVNAPADFVVVSNAPTTTTPAKDAPGVWQFAPTERISTYITAVVAGSYVHVDDSYVRSDGSQIALGLYVRRSLASYLDHEEIFTVTKQSFAAFEELFEMNYPFAAKYDQLFVPEFSAGAMENSGCVTFSEAYIFRSKVTDALRERRAETIIHEMAHMWFGDLVTMRWWDDLWLNESFATFMAVYVQARYTRFTDAWVTFLDAEKAWALFQDQLPSTHPVADDMPDVESVHQNFDGITYAKGASVLRQLVAWVGEDAFFAGCRHYFAAHAWGNTTLHDFLASLEAASGRDLVAWRDEWLLTTGPNAVAIEVTHDTSGVMDKAAVIQTAPTPLWADPHAPLSPPVLRRHRLAIGAYNTTNGLLTRTHRVELDVSGATTDVTELVGLPQAELLLVNDDDLTYAKTMLDETALATVTKQLRHVAEPLPRALLWSSLWDMVRDGVLPARRYLAIVSQNVTAEDKIGVLQRLLQRQLGALERYTAQTYVPTLRATLAEAAKEAFEQAAPGSDFQLAWFKQFTALAAGDPAYATLLTDLLAGSYSPEGLTVDVDLRWYVVTQLASSGTTDSAMIDREQADDNTDLGERQAATARAALPDVSQKEAAWQRLLTDVNLSHTVSRHIIAGFNQLHQGDILAGFVAQYFAVLPRVWDERSLDWSVEFSAGMFPHYQASAALLDTLDEYVASTSTLPKPLIRVLREQRDTLVRTLNARALDETFDTASST